MVDRLKKPTALSTNAPSSQVQVTTSFSDSCVSATLPTGESITVLLHGATITSWKDKSGNDLLWLSKAAKLDGSKPVRGGIPLVFPVFGSDSSHAATSKLPQHGFARTSKWEFLGKSTTEPGDGDSVNLDFGLQTNNLDEETRKLWPYSFGLIYSVTLAQKGLTTSILVINKGETALEFQTLMHSYFKIEDIFSIEITGLESTSYVDKLSDPIITKTSLTSPVKISSRTDQVYTLSDDNNQPVSILEKGKKKFSISRDNLNEVVVWNPWSEGVANMTDFAPSEGYKEMICVESGAVKDWVELGPGESWSGSQTISIF
ncbi:Glucose-6-phosphate 1-epimerase [Erysiphe neolycopersici]|uniref:Glucose-6-phosphate 1-epimerase n=1 Tax=Erysiphe neolycopersici TaxID=212602 RepID=A0A420I3B1_9PEZI|nr:Glucose-6-phosphate 1-epimerase [Erysiphe neolycopersici]